MTSNFKEMPASHDAIAPDGSAVRILLALARGGLAHFQLEAGDCSVAVHHRTVEEIWYFVAGNGEMWLGGDGHATNSVHPGMCVAIPRATPFQFRSFGPGPLAAIGVTMPPWPGDGEAIRSVGPWEPTVDPGPGLAEEQR